jgi:two-component system sensor histidine kinase/response regulator
MKPENMTILTVDDTPANIRLLTHYLEKQGYKVLTAEDGFEGFKAAIQYHPDLVLLDVMMPGTDGYEVCELLKAEEETKDIPVMFLTAKADVEDRIRGFELGAVDYITKPFNLIEISTRVKTHLKLKYLEKQQNQTQKILLQLQKLAILGKSDSVFFHQLFQMSEEIKGYLKTIASSTAGNGVHAQELKKLNELLQKMQQTLSDLKSFSSATASDTGNILINEMIDSVLELVQPTVHNSIHFKIDMPKTSPVMQGNVGMVYQAILNLFLNALESAIHGGTIAAKISEGSLPKEIKAEPGTNPNQQYIHIAMTDAGLRKEQVKFDKQYGIYSTAKNNLNAGIRLTAIQAIAEQHQGFLRLKNEDGEKLTVSIYFPSVNT